MKVWLFQDPLYWDYGAPAQTLILLLLSRSLAVLPFPLFPIWCQTACSCGEDGDYRPVWALFSWIIYGYCVSQEYKCGAGLLSQDRRTSHINIQKTQDWSIQIQMYLQLNNFLLLFLATLWCPPSLRGSLDAPRQRQRRGTFDRQWHLQPWFWIVNHFANTPPPGRGASCYQHIQQPKQIGGIKQVLPHQVGCLNWCKQQCTWELGNCW